MHLCIIIGLLSFTWLVLTGYLIFTWRVLTGYLIFNWLVSVGVGTGVDEAEVFRCRGAFSHQIRKERAR